MIAFLFPGQGVQRPGMADEYVQNWAESRNVFERISHAVGWDVLKLTQDGPQPALDDTRNAQLCMLATNLAALAAFQAEGVTPQLAAGFSLGEYAALCCAGYLALEDTARIVQKRSQYMAQHARGGMAAVLGIDAAEVERLCAQVDAGRVQAVNYNCPGQTVVAGEQDALAELAVWCKENRIRMVPLQVSGAFHSFVMDPAAEALSVDLEKLTFSPPRLPMVFNRTARQPQPGQSIAALLTQQCNHPVLWEASIRHLIELGATAFVECGPGKVLTGLLKRICPDIPAYTSQDAASLQSAAKAFNQGGEYHAGK